MTNDPPTAPAGYPLMLDVSTRLAVIVGGGGVAARKARGLLDAGATRVRAVAMVFAENFPAVAERIAAPFDASHLGGAALVFAATNDPATNDAVVREGRRRGALTCRADREGEDAGDFTTPALLREGALVVGVSAGGSPALAAAVRDGLRDRLDPAWRAMAQAMVELRPRVRSGCADAGERRLIFRDLASPEGLGVVGRGGIAALRDWLGERYPRLRV